MKSASNEQKKAEVLTHVKERVRERWSGKGVDEVERFVGIYYEAIAPEDIAESRVTNLYGAALSHWSLGYQRATGESKIHVYNPDAEQNGWECAHSVVQIVTDDMPFLVDSVSMAINRRGLTVHLIIHPVLRTERDAKGRLSSVRDDASDDSPHEAWMHFEVDRQTEEEVLSSIHEDVAGVIEDVRLAVEDWRAMRAQVDKVIKGLKREVPKVDDAEREEIAEFLRWVRDDHFTLLGYRRYDLRRKSKRDELVAVADSSLGVMRRSHSSAESTSFAALPPEVREQARKPAPLILTKSTSRATVHRPGYMDYIGVKRHNAKGEVIGEHRFLGLYTSAAYNRSPRGIPLLRRKVEWVLERASLRPTSHAGKALTNILETYPRDELFQASREELYDATMGILQLQERQRVRLFVRYDNYLRFVSCLVYAPRERYNTEVREKMQAIFNETFDAANTEFSVQLSESVLARIHFIVRLKEPGRPDYDHQALERRLAQTTRAWPDDLQEALLEHFGEGLGNRLFNRYGHGVSAAYREDTGPRTAAKDIERLETLSESDSLAISLYRPLEAPQGLMRFRLYQAGGPISLSDALPVLENMGVRVVDEHPYDITRRDGYLYYIHDFGLQHPNAGQLEAEQLRDIFQEAFGAVWRREAEDDGFNRLVVAAGLRWQDIVILRAYARYLRQAGTSFSQAYVEDTLAENPGITANLTQLFHARFDPRNHDAKRAAKLEEDIQSALEEVASLDQDRILRRLLAAIRATLRTNYYRSDEDGNARGFLSLKLSPADIPGVPKPVPAFEIFMYCPRVEGVHLRGGKVARGGVRWSDRREDYRTEILGLMKAQMVKNAVIVPVGAKGGFVCKQLPSDRQAVFAEVLACYRTFVRALLDVTDNIVDSKVVPPPEVLRHDDDDPYLVVAADKGTATFSDDANEIAQEYGFWLRDAFASGGSAGYDHKKMAITARSGWVAVERHFREMGKDIRNEPFDVVGVGDMSGDVFGNGMLLSRQIRLVAAFDHRHVFIDPSPDPQASFAERERLFKMPRSSWDDYDRKLISKGGGVWPRTAKSINLGKEARAALDIEAGRLTPNELINAILKAPVDLLWNGGIGTYVKASDESNADVGDKANDGLRVDGEALRCHVVGEGGNLGVTQLGRVEFALNGGRINTDAIDNAGGVNCSDHEVNIKILLNRVVDSGDLTVKQRNQLLARMTEEVAKLVLHDSYRQTQGLTLMRARAGEMLDEHARFMRELERMGKLDRYVEQLPDEEGIGERSKAGIGLTRPELAVLLAYAKIAGYQELLESDLVNSDYLAGELVEYFPSALGKRFLKPVHNHPLRGEIIATVVTNHVINRMGATFLHRLRANTGVTASEATRAYFAARDIYELRPLWHEVDALDSKVPAHVQTELLAELTHLQERATQWLLRNLPSPIDIEETVTRMRPAVAELESRLDDLLPESDQEQLAAYTNPYVEVGVPKALARRIALLETLYAALDMVKVCADTGASLERAARLYFAVGTSLGLDWLRHTLVGQKVENPWQERYRAGLTEEFYVQRRVLTRRVLQSSGERDEPAEELVEQWCGENRAMAERMQRTLDELGAAVQVDLSMLGVALQELRNLSQSGAAASALLSSAAPATAPTNGE